jgi:hypothetical protein
MFTLSDLWQYCLFADLTLNLIWCAAGAKQQHTDEQHSFWNSLWSH